MAKVKIERCIEKAIKIPKEKRQEFLDLLWDEHTIGEARKIIDVDFETALGIFNLNLDERRDLRKVTA